MSKPFWETKSLSEMSREEWELICDGCAKCCLNQVINEDTIKASYTRLHCRLLDRKTCRCKNYDERQKFVPECISMQDYDIALLELLPDSCSYRRLADGRGLEKWHHLICGDRDLIHKLGHSIQSWETVCETEAKVEDWNFYVVRGEGGEY